jgi:hypothetical protein
MRVITLGIVTAVIVSILKYREMSLSITRANAFLLIQGKNI